MSQIDFRDYHDVRQSMMKTVFAHHNRVHILVQVNASLASPEYRRIHLLSFINSTHKSISLSGISFSIYKHIILQIHVS